MTPNVPYYEWDFNLSTPLDPANPQPFECDNPAKGPDNESRWNTGQTIDPVSAPGRVQTPRLTQPDIWYSYRDNQNPAFFQGTPCHEAYDGDARAAPGRRAPRASARSSSPSCSRAASGRTARRRTSSTRTTRARRSSRRTTTGRRCSASSRRTRCVRSGSTRTTRCSRSTRSSTAGRRSSRRTFPFECDNPMDLQFGADGNFYLLTYGDGFFQPNADAGMYRWEYTKGPQRPQAVVSATPRNGQAPLTVQFSSDGLGRRGSGRLDHVRLGLPRTTARSTRRTRTRGSRTPPTGSTRPG